MKFFKFISFYFLLTIFYLLLPKEAFAEGEFQTNYQTTYLIEVSGDALVSQQITLTNNFSKIYANSYVLSLEGKLPEEIRADEEGRPIDLSVEQEENKTKITVNFPQALVGKGKSRIFTISYKVKQVASQNGNVWELAIPKLSTPASIDEYMLTLTVPSAFGNPAFISPQPRLKDVTNEGQNYVFDKDDLIRAGIVAAFGDFQVFDFNLSYHLQNPYSQHGETEIALPPDTAFQRVYYNQLNPKPQSISVDSDGNWLAKYRLEPKQNLDVEANLSVQIFSQPQNYFINEDPFDYYLSPSKYWEVNDPKIQELGKSLKTPRNIYNYVVNRLKYDYSRVRDDVPRLGAKNALANPESAICMEFTDLFVALARAAGIPAREVNGYAYTNNPQLQPLSLVADVLHAWPEYWDQDLQAWKPIDPTWENTTGGIDFFDKFDLEHITFAIHGKDPETPLPAGSYKSATNQQKDVQVRFGTLPEVRNSTLKMESFPPQLVLPFKSSTLRVKIANEGPVALYNVPLEVVSSNILLEKIPPQIIKFLAPYSSAEYEITFKIPFFIAKNTSSIYARAEDAKMEYNITAKNAYIIQIAFIFALILLLVSGLVFSPKLLAHVSKLWKK